MRRVVAHTTGADRGDPNAQPSLVKHVSEGDTVKLKSMGRAAVVKKKIGENHFDVEIGSMKMRIARDDIAEVLTSARTSRRSRDSPVASRALTRHHREAAKRIEHPQHALRNQRHRAHG